MAIGSANLASTGVVAEAQRILDGAPAQMREFEEVLGALEERQGGGQTVQSVVGSGPEAVAKPAAGGVYSESVERAREPGGMERLLDEAQAGYRRLAELIGQIEGGRTFSAQELLALQAEVHQVSLQVEVTTKVIGELVSNVRHLMQQQV